MRKPVGEFLKMGVDPKSSNPYGVPSPKYLCVGEFMIFGLIFFWFVLK